VINLLLAIVLTSLMYFIFKGFDHFKVQTFQAIAVNYVVCVITGIAFSGLGVVTTDTLSLPIHYFLYPILIGGLFVIGFNMIAYVSQKISVSLATVASRLSLIIPIVIGLFFFKSSAKTYDVLNVIGIILVFVAIIFVSLPTKNEKSNIQKVHLWLLPTLFVLIGFIDTILTYTNSLFQKNHFDESLSVMIFVSAAVFALLASLILKKHFTIRSILGGLILGVPSYFSVYFLMKALSSFNHDSAFVFSINNLSVIVLTTITSVVLLKEKIAKLNVLGLVLAVVSLLLIVYQDLV
jgi:drug/metabolite transporter (DMT)-like permease